MKIVECLSMTKFFLSIFYQTYFKIRGGIENNSKIIFLISQ